MKTLHTSELRAVSGGFKHLYWDEATSDAIWGSSAPSLFGKIHDAEASGKLAPGTARLILGYGLED